MRYVITLSCSGVPKDAGPEAAVDITREFAEHRTWHQNASCTWDGSKLTLTAENDCDSEGLALFDEFSDCICAYVEPFDGSINIDSVVTHDA
jgi:hypothetical protein